VSDLDTVRQILFGADLARLEQALADDRQQAAARLGEQEQRLERRLDELSQKVTAQLDELSRRQQAHADRVTQLLDQVMAELTRRADALGTEARAGLEELRAKVSDLERRKLNVADFGSSLATLGQRFSAPADDGAQRG
jgi:DNA anti-recombination protein RmuC